MKPRARVKFLFLAPIILAGSIAVVGLLHADEPPVRDDFKAPERLGAPDAKQFPGLKQVQPEGNVWVDMKNKRVLTRAGVCLRKGPVELLACNHRWVKDPISGKTVRQGTKEYESIVTINAPAAVIHAALLAIGAKSGSPVNFAPEYEAAHGTAIEIMLHWEDKQGKRHEARAQQWVRNTKTNEPLKYSWVFAGSRFVKLAENGQEHYLAENGNVICVSNFSDAMLDLPIKSTQVNDALLYEAFTEHIPPVGTPVTIVLQPKAKESEQ